MPYNHCTKNHAHGTKIMLLRAVVINVLIIGNLCYLFNYYLLFTILTNFVIHYVDIQAFRYDYEIQVDMFPTCAPTY